MTDSDLTRAAEALRRGIGYYKYTIIRTSEPEKIRVWQRFADDTTPKITDVTAQMLATWSLDVIDGLCAELESRCEEIKDMKRRMMSREKLGRIEGSLRDLRRALEIEP